MTESCIINRCNEDRVFFLHLKALVVNLHVFALPLVASDITTSGSLRFNFKILSIKG